MPVSRLVIAAFLSCCALVAAGCGGGGDDDPGAKPPAIARPEDFPDAAGKTLADLRNELPEGGPVLAPAVSVLTVGRDRFAFGLFDRARTQIADASVAVYVAPAGGGEASGPYVARWESLKVDAPFQSQTVKSDPDSARSIYVSRPRFGKPGTYDVLGIAKLDNRLVAATPAGGPLEVVAKAKDPVPGVGDKAPRTHTPTEADVGGALAQIDTRRPFSTMHDVDFADVVGKEPVVLLFATPLLCQSRVCGPVVDIAEQVKSQVGDKVEFVHMEIYKDNEVSKGFRPQVGEWNLPTEPWAFVVGRDGKIVARLEGAYSARELTAAVKKALAEKD